MPVSKIFFPPYPAASVIHKTMPLPIGAPPPTGPYPPFEVLSRGVGGAWAISKRLEIITIAVRVKILFGILIFRLASLMIPK